jgi:hypothetical protein
LYLARSDLECDGDTIETIYQKRWEVETFHKILKSNAALEKIVYKKNANTKQPFFMTIYAAFGLGELRVKHHMNPYALKAMLYPKAIRYSF